MRIYFFSIFIFIACNSENNEVELKQSIMSPIPTLKNTDFKEYWNNLGLALKVNDTLKLEKFFESSVFIYGREDEDPRFVLNGRDRIVRVREIYLSGGYYDENRLLNVSYRDFFSDKNVLDLNFVSNQDTQRIEDFIFAKSDFDEWKLIGVYTNTRDIDH